MRRRTIPLLATLGIVGAGLVVATDTAPSGVQQTGDDERRSAERSVTTSTSSVRLAGLSSPDLGPLPARSEATPAGAQAPYAPGQAMVSPSAGVSLDELARDHGAVVMREQGRSGYGVLAGEPGLVEALKADDRVAGVSPQGLIVGAAKGGQARWTDSGSTDGSSSSQPDAGALQWHIEAAEIWPASDWVDFSSLVVAVLDTGVAYEDWTDDSGTYAQAPSLATAPIVAPWDFVNGDSHANDDHQHGTHIASVIASDGDVLGTAAGVQLMPLKVLDHNNSGYEHDLVEALWWAADNGADVVNMSLSFGEGYVPSAALLEALAAADAAGAVMVGAAGNIATSEVTWPAASPHVLAVGATCPDNNSAIAAPYSNLGGAMDVMAPGGCMDRDDNHDDYPDGILAETIALQDPTLVEYWWMSGTSQAAAITSGAVARVLAAGAQPGDVALVLQTSATLDFGKDSFIQGMGAGSLDTWGAMNRASTLSHWNKYRYYVSVLPWLADNGDGTVTPSALLTARDSEGAEVNEVELLVDIHGSSRDSTWCSLSSSSCVVSGPAVDATEKDGAPAALAWRFVVNGAVDSNQVVLRPERMMFAGDEHEALAALLNADPTLREALLAISWEQADDPDLGPVAEGYSVVDTGSGLASSPLGLVFTPSALPVSSEEQLDLSGTGLASSPLGMRLLTLDGSGLASSPPGFSLLTLDTLDGSGLASSPLGFATYSTLDGSGLASSPLGFSAVMLDSGKLVGGDMSGAGELGLFLEDGAWSTTDGEQGASLLNSSGLVSAPAAAVGDGSGLASSPVGFSAFSTF